MSAENIVSLEAHRRQRERIELAIIGEVAWGTGTKPFLGRASDGKMYWCKRLESDHGREAVVNEVAASIIGDRLGARVRPWNIIYVPEGLRNSMVGAGLQRYRLSGTPLFGSETLHSGTLQQDFEVIPHVTDDSNPNQIPKLIAMWVLCNAQEDLQILVDSADDYALWSIDHGLWFDSAPYPWGFSPIDSPTGVPRIPMLREKIPTRSWNKAIDALDRLDKSLCDVLWDALPPEWGISESEANALINYALSRKDTTGDILKRYRDKQGI
ncbi:HipA family kinase [Corynebacterium sp. NML130628]|uniref:HipA family kinase n=1 Tax=Corynebacterium sp. NML130628 TaxID=1906333 RepID=UPI0008FB5BD0|nr:HipA family kinase [Corynebacterium sp. NML130628]OIR45771.1 hypothetical protein BJP07_02600 [Corynebacterium sp. NML130628]